ncbi:MAG TPA: FAD-dependent oxidoreductase, partial [Opitutales bacterium]|nr:FAD-dependent oxidoreductase [Opitutales bacterium]
RTTQPKSLIILGAGAIGVEFAYFMQTLGTQVTLVEMMPRILPIEDSEVSGVVERAFKKTGMQVLTSAKAENVRSTPKGITLEVVQGDKRETLEAESLLVAVGVAANTEGLLSNKVNLAQDRGFITVNERYESSVPGIYAAGDIIGPPWLAHVATYEAIQAVQGIFGVSNPKRVLRFPGCTYCQPQVASIGLTEDAAKEQGLDYQVGKFPFSASGKAVAMNHPEGFVKLITLKPHGELIGAHIVGVDATELIAEYALAMEVEATVDDIHATIHPHPTLSEALAEAAAATHGEAIHI